MRVFTGVAELVAASGEELGVSGWHEITQEQVDLFADATGDHQWIHVDVERAAAGPFGGTIAHGYLTLALVPRLVHEIYAVEGVSMGMNYGADRIRFVTPVPVGARVRAHARLAVVVEASNGVRTILAVTVELEGVARPALVAQVVYLVIP